MASDFDAYHRWLGISPKDQPPHRYRLLGIELYECDPDVIATAADQRMAQLKTYQTGPNSALSQQLLNEVAAARVCLLNSAQKESYDAQLRSELPPEVNGLPPIVPAATPVIPPILPVGQVLAANLAPPPVANALETAVRQPFDDYTSVDVVPEFSTVKRLPTRRAKVKRSAWVSFLMWSISIPAAILLSTFILKLVRRPAEPLTKLQVATATDTDPLGQLPTPPSSRTAAEEELSREATALPAEKRILSAPVETETDAGDTDARGKLTQVTGSAIPPTSSISGPKIDKASKNIAETELPSGGAPVAVVPRAVSPAVPAPPFIVDPTEDGLDLSAEGPGLLAQYYYNRDFTHPVLAQVETAIEHRWHNSSFSKGFHTNAFFARYTGWLSAPAAGDYSFRLQADDGVRLWIDGQMVFDEWTGKAGIFKTQIHLEERPHAVRLEYRQANGPATLLWRWRMPGKRDYQKIDAEYLRPARLSELPESTRKASSLTPKPLAKSLPGEAPRGEPAALPVPVGKWIDLLALVDPGNHSVKGHWQRRGTDLVCDATDSPRCMIPVTVAGNFELNCEFSRRAGDDATFILFPIGDSACAVLVSAFHGASSGLEMLDGRVVNDIAPSTGASVRPGLIANDLRHRMHLDVSQSGGQAAITASIDNQPIVNWRGSVDQLSRPVWEILPCDRAIGIMANRCNVEFHKLELRLKPGGVGYALGSDWQNPLCAVSQAPPGEVAAKCVQWEGHSYLFSEKPMNLADAQRLARKLQGRLLTISSEAEEGHIIQSARGVFLWTAGWRAALTVQWRDDRNRPLKYLPKWAPGQYSNAEETFLAFSTAADNSRGLHDSLADGIWNVCIEWGEE